MWRSSKLLNKFINNPFKVLYKILINQDPKTHRGEVMEILQFPFKFNQKNWKQPLT